MLNKFEILILGLSLEELEVENLNLPLNILFFVVFSFPVVPPLLAPNIIIICQKGKHKDVSLNIFSLFVKGPISNECRTGPPRSSLEKKEQHHPGRERRLLG